MCFTVLHALTYGFSDIVTFLPCGGIKFDHFFPLFIQQSFIELLLPNNSARN